jgi:hypothetical protein
MTARRSRHEASKSVVRAAALVGVGVLAPSCVDDPVGIDVSLYADLRLNTLEQVLDTTDSLEVVLDSADGLYFPGDEMDDGTIAIRDADGDPSDLELVARVAEPTARLPRIRIQRGGLGNVPIEVTILGYAGTTVVAEGAFPAMLTNSHVEVSVPFNLVPEFRAPRVERVIAAAAPGCTPPLLSIIFSRPILATSVQGPGVFTFEPGGAPTLVIIDSVEGLGSVALVRPPADVATGTNVKFKLTVATSIVDEVGTQLDQTPFEDGPQPFVGQYVESPCR